MKNIVILTDLEDLIGKTIKFTKTINTGWVDSPENMFLIQTTDDEIMVMESYCTGYGGETTVDIADEKSVERNMELYSEYIK